VVGDTIRSHKDLDVWKLSMDLAEQCYRATKPFPREEQYGFTSQIRRSAVSIPANIAEGYGRDGIASFVQFLRIAQGSQKELETHLLLAFRVELLVQNDADPILAVFERVGKMLRNLTRSLEAKKMQP
jgi:four helix bundle protein